MELCFCCRKKVTPTSKGMQTRLRSPIYRTKIVHYWYYYPLKKHFCEIHLN